MKFASFRSGDLATYGGVTNGTIRPVAGDFRARYPDLKSAIAAGLTPDIFDAIDYGPDIELAHIQFDPVIPNPGKIFGVGMNYRAHIKEMGRTPSKYPAVFVRFPDSLVGHRQPVIRPKVSQQFDYEGELAVIIGRTARNVSAAAAMDYVAGYSCFLDGSIRDYQYHTSQFIPGKNFPQSGAFGPWMVTVDEIADLRELHLATRVNGDVMQRGDIGDLCIGIGELIQYLSTICQLNPGDVIATGTPSGVGYAQDPQRWLKPGDRIEIEIDQIGCLENQVADEA
ncbi:MAG: fumarylacetoacetate hydrolase family protein [Gammaproteobacteria bacterium]|nr:fumarylacetoacetate hydrolase family protein [Gammaproteobacteria bacterium]